MLCLSGLPTALKKCPEIKLALRRSLEISESVISRQIRN